MIPPIDRENCDFPIFDALPLPKSEATPDVFDFLSFPFERFIVSSSCFFYSFQIKKQPKSIRQHSLPTLLTEIVSLAGQKNKAYKVTNHIGL
jgi:hypothetical protein